MTGESGDWEWSLWPDTMALASTVHDATHRPLDFRNSPDPLPIRNYGRLPFTLVLLMLLLFLSLTIWHVRCALFFLFFFIFFKIVRHVLKYPSPQCLKGVGRHEANWLVQGSWSSLERRHTNKEKIWIAYGNSHLACEYNVHADELGT